MSVPGQASVIEASSCRSCNRYYIPHRQLCPGCRGALQKETVEGKGRILSWTVVHVTPEGVPAPRTVALVGLDCGAAVLCLVTDNRALGMGSVAEVVLVDGQYHMK